jgi:hypothetical protein
VKRPARAGRRPFGATLPPAPALQAAYYIVTGLWPLLSYRTFEWVSGPKREPWLVKTVGLLTVVIGAALVTAGRDHPRPVRGASGATLGIGTALSYAAVDLWYAGIRRRISPVYLLDALAEMALVGVWWLQIRGGSGRQ